MDRSNITRLPPLEIEALARTRSEENEDNGQVVSRCSTASPQLGSSGSRRVRAAPRLDPLRSPFHGSPPVSSDGGYLPPQAPCLPLRQARRIRAKTTALSGQVLAGQESTGSHESRDTPTPNPACSFDKLAKTPGRRKGSAVDDSGRRRPRSKKRFQTEVCFGLSAGSGANREVQNSPSHVPRSSSGVSIRSRVSQDAFVSKVKSSGTESKRSDCNGTPTTIVTPSTCSSSCCGHHAAPAAEDLLSIKEWRRGHKIGQGSYGCVYKGLEITTGRIFAVKKAAIQSTDSEDRKFVEKLSEELDIFRHLRHENIVSFLGHEFNNGELCIFMEYASGGSLQAMIQEFGPLRGKLLADAALGMISGLDYLHTRNPPVIHRDIKSANVLVDKEFGIKLSDFGCSKRCDVSTTYTTKGSIPWMAPEVIQQQNGYGRKADIWSLGCTIIELATAETPWGKGAFDNVMSAIKLIGMTEEIPPVPSDMQIELQALVSSCLQRDAYSRPMASDLVSHPAFSSPTLSSTEGLADVGTR